MSQHIRRNSGGDEDSEAGSGGDDSDFDIGHPLSDESSTCPERRVRHYCVFSQRVIHFCFTENPYKAGSFTVC
jgi:hypothetical protein